MRKIREILRLVWECGLSHRQASRSGGVSRTTVQEYVWRAEECGLNWELAAALSAEELELRLYASPVAVVSSVRPAVDFLAVHQELRQKGVTLALLWQEYKEREPSGYQYSQYCERYRRWHRRLDLSMRQSHKAGEKLFVDYAGLTVPIAGRTAGEVRAAQIFVAVLGASNYTYAEATWTQGTADWLGAHARCFAFFGGVPELVVPDNLRSGVTKACRYEPEVNRSYHDLALHYGVAVLPARVVRPRDKAKVEVGVQVVERWILARLRHRQFFSLPELNMAIGELLEQLNRRRFRKLPGSRRSVFEELERAALRPLPAAPYEYAEWKKARVGIDYHVEVDGHYYSVPYQLVRLEIEVRLAARTVECFAKGKRVASHARVERRGGHTTLAPHMPQGHRDYAEWTPQRLVRWAGESGAAVASLIELILASRMHPQQGFRACLGIQRLGKRYGAERLEAACRRALALEATTYRSVRSILEKGLDRQPLLAETQCTPILHENLRGASYYQAEALPC